MGVCNDRKSTVWKAMCAGVLASLLTVSAGADTLVLCTNSSGLVFVKSQCSGKTCDTSTDNHDARRLVGRKHRVATEHGARSSRAWL